MPKITRVISTERPGALQLPRNVPFATAEDLGAGAFRELERFGGTLLKVAQQLQDQADDLELAEAKGKFDAGVADAALEAEKAPDFFERPALFARDTRQLASDLTKSIKSNTVKRAFTGFVVRRLPAQIINVKADALKAMHRDQSARLRDHLEFLKRQIAEQTSEDAQDELTAFGVDLVNRAQARNVETPESARVLRTGFLGDIVEIQIRQQIQLDPFLAEDTLRSEEIDIDPLKKLNLLRTTTVRQRELLRLDREAEKEADRKFREERRIAVGGLVTRAREGTLTLDQIEEERQVFGFGATEVNLLRSFVENEPQGISDPRIKDDVIQRVNDVPPRVTENELERLFEQHRQGGRGLNRNDFVTQRDRLRRMAVASKSEVKEDIRFRHAQGQAQIKLSLRFQSPFGLFDQAANQTLAVAMLEFNDRSAALVPGGEDPFLLSKEIIAKFLPTFLLAAQAALDVTRRTLRFQTKQSLLNAKDAIGDVAYYAEVAKLEQVAIHERELELIRAEIQRGEAAGPIFKEPKPLPPREERPPPPPGLEPTPSTLRPSPTTPSPGTRTEPGLRITR